MSRRGLLAGAVAAVVAVVAFVVATRPDTASQPARRPPTAPPAQVCGNAAILTGPASAPAGAVVVNPGQNLYDATQASPPGTT
ncbi:MAG: right-handed parallel beta-helix repeat-containing protein, partial [Actinomycetota bacterium]|nr:right-handed parallel beta-helix repeat-containing protein [Actinomycetota bacterium]